MKYRVRTGEYDRRIDADSKKSAATTLMRQILKQQGWPQLPGSVGVITMVEPQGSKSIYDATYFSSENLIEEIYK